MKTLGKTSKNQTGKAREGISVAIVSFVTQGLNPALRSYKVSKTLAFKPKKQGPKTLGKSSEIQPENLRNNLIRLRESLKP